MDSVSTDSVMIDPTVEESIRTHSRQQQAKGNWEAVGFVGAKRGVGVATVPLNNHAVNPQEAFFVEPWEQYRAEKKLYEGGYKILGVYHSHPSAEAFPSMADHAMARPGEVVFIYSVPFDELRAYRELEGTLTPIPINEGSSED